jgi:RHS repeat-associated protein
VTGRVEYDEWGKPSVITPGLEPNYTGYEYDQTMGIYYAKARFYDPVNLRMLSEDPVRYGLNLYTYCDNNPIMLIDPWGLAAISIREFMNEYHGTTTWDEINRIATFSVNGKTLTTGVTAGAKDNVKYWNNIGCMMAEDTDLITYFFDVSKDDQDKGVKIVFRYGNYYQDVTIPVQTAVYAAESTFKEHSIDFTWFKPQVGSDKNPDIITAINWFMKQVGFDEEWDIKKKDSWEDTIGTEYPGSNSALVIYNGEFATLEKLGNITYGYLGKAMNFPDDIVIAGSIYANGIWKYAINKESRENEYKDHGDIRIGMEWYERMRQ